MTTKSEKVKIPEATKAEELLDLEEIRDEGPRARSDSLKIEKNEEIKNS